MLGLTLTLAAVFPVGMYPPQDGREAAGERVAEVYAAIDAATDDPDLRSELRAICKRESWCNWYRRKAVHAADASLGRKRWRKAVDRGLLDPERCEAHRLGGPDEWGWWSTVGAFGAVSAYVVRHVGECVSPRELVDPKLAVRAVIGHMDVLCRRHKACTCEARARWWAGPGRWDARSPITNIRKLEHVCGDQPGVAWASAFAKVGIMGVARFSQVILHWPGELLRFSVSVWRLPGRAGAEVQDRGRS